jgi:hypothetical protein
MHYRCRAKAREPLAMPARLHLRELGPNGQLLVGQGVARRGMVMSSSDGETQRNFPWLDFSLLRAISDDGKTILFEEEGNETTNHTVYVPDVNGSPAVPIGEGMALRSRPTGSERWPSNRPSPPTKFDYTRWVPASRVGRGRHRRFSL